MSTAPAKKTQPKKVKKQEVEEKSEQKVASKAAPKKVASKKEPKKEIPPPQEEEEKEEVKGDEVKKVVKRKITKDRVWDELQKLKKTALDLCEDQSKDPKKKIGSRKITQLKNQIDNLHKHTSRLFKKEPKRPANENSGLNKQVQATPELLKFMSLKAGTTVRRVDVTTFLCSYVKVNELKNKERPREILPDKALQKLLDYDEERDGVLTYCSIQKLIQKHFIKSVPVKAEAEAVVDEDEDEVVEDE
jgi:chromatin remodeling complex protein RSC6